MRRLAWPWAAACFLLFVTLLTMSGMPPTTGSRLRLLILCGTFAGAMLVDPARLGRLRGLCIAADGFLLFSAMSATGAIASYLAMRNSGPFTDAWLAQADGMVGFDWLGFRSAVDRIPLLRATLEQAYYSCFLLPPAIAILLGMSGRAERLYKMLAAFGIGLAATVAIFLFFPAEAAFQHYGYRPMPSNAVSYGVLISQLHDGPPEPVDLNALGGIITFPSFHATMAILFAWALWPLRRLRVPNLGINGLMWISAIPVGGHDAVDLIGGSLIAGISLGLVADQRRRHPRKEISPVQSGAAVPR
ncbi:phosphatase PAP2 family protein [Sphingomonas sp. RS6]